MKPIQTRMQIRTFLTEYLPVLVKGILMGICDIIPGVSGGTVAFITGIYGRLIAGIANISPNIIIDLIRWDLPSFRSKLEQMDIVFLIVLACGIGSAFLLASRVMLWLLHEYPVQTNGFFFGLILASSVLLFAPLPRRYPGSFIFLIIGIVLGLGIVMLNPSSLGHSYPILFLTGFIALCAMILPGISGAYITLIMNQYEYLLNAIKTLSLPDIGAYLIGGVLGILTFTRLLKYLLKYYHDLIVAILTGLMLGSSKLLFDRATETTPIGIDLMVSVILGILVVGLFQYSQTYMNKRSLEKL
jgi:putative membrane protein